MNLHDESPNLDLLRSVAVLLVLGSHILTALGLPWEHTAIGSVAHLGVLLFFIHTSLVLMMSLARLEQSDGSLVSRFYIRRAFRIYPLAITAVLFVVAFGVPADFWTPFRFPTTTELWANLLLVQNIGNVRSLTGPLWSLPFEVQMYLTLPFLYLLGKRIGRPLALIGLGFVVWYIDHRLSLRFGYRALLGYAPWFFMGVAAYFRRPKRQLPFWLFPICLFAVVGAEVAIGRIVDYRAAWLEWLVGVAFSLALPMFQELPLRFFNKMFSLIAKYSYGIYLSHVPILWFVVDGMAGKSILPRIALGVILTITMPALLYYGIEKPFIRLGSRLATPHRVKVLAIAT